MQERMNYGMNFKMIVKFKIHFLEAFRFISSFETLSSNICSSHLLMRYTIYFAYKFEVSYLDVFFQYIK